MLARLSENIKAKLVGIRHICLKSHLFDPEAEHKERTQIFVYVGHNKYAFKVIVQVELDDDSFGVVINPFDIDQLF